jgi:hypothetical protein
MNRKKFVPKGKPKKQTTRQEDEAATTMALWEMHRNRR